VIDNYFNLSLFCSRDRDRRPILSAGSNQLRQDLVAVDRHRPNLCHEVGGLDVRLFKFNTQQGTSLIVEQLRRKSDEYLFYI
jgi:hypothetical protein